MNEEHQATRTQKLKATRFTTPIQPQTHKGASSHYFQGGYGAKYVKAVFLTFECLPLLLLKATRTVSASPLWLWPSTWSLCWLQMATSSALSREQQKAGRVMGWPLNPINALPPLIGRQHNLTACLWLLTMLPAEAVLLHPCSLVLPVPTLGLGPASYFLQWGTRARHLEKQWSLPLWEASRTVTQILDFGD